MGNLYHILHNVPALEREDMYIELENLANNLVDSGLLRIDANLKCNFVRFSLPRARINKMFSKRQLYDKELLPYTKIILKNSLSILYGNYNINERVNNTIKQLRKDLNKKLPIDYTLEIKLARIIVQCTHPVVIQLILLEKVEVFISYSYSIADLLDVVTWQTAGQNSGMQSTDGKNVAIFISCGGDPTKISNKKKKSKQKDPPQDEPTYGDGMPALARAMIIGGQEFGHYADIMRNKFGQQISRHSADFGGYLAKEHVRIARLNDLNNISILYDRLCKIGLNTLAEEERYTKFFRKNRVKSFFSIIKFISSKILKFIFVKKAQKMNFLPIKKFSKEKYTGISINEMLQDMAFNLAPRADVYRNENKQIEEAIACIEALARVPQQVNKWGEETVKYIWPEMFNIYYLEIIPSRINDFEFLTGSKFTLYPNNFTKLPAYTRFLTKANKWIKNKLLKKLFNKNKL